MHLANICRPRLTHELCEFEIMIEIRGMKLSSFKSDRNAGIEETKSRRKSSSIRSSLRSEGEAFTALLNWTVS